MGQPAVHFEIGCRDSAATQEFHIGAALAKAGSLGGKTLVPAVAIPNGSFVWFADPEDNAIGLWKPA